MLNLIKELYTINSTYTMNSFIYWLRKWPIFKDLFTDDIYKVNTTKGVFSVLASIVTFIKNFIKELFFTLFVFAITYSFSGLKIDTLSLFIYTYLSITIIRYIFTSRYLLADTKKYLCINLCHIEVKEYNKANTITTMFTTFIMQLLSLIIIIFSSKISIIYALILALDSSLIILIGNAISVFYYKKHNNILLRNTSKYYILDILVLLIPLILIILHININIVSSLIILGILVITSIISYKYIAKNNDIANYYKRLNVNYKPISDKDIKMNSRVALISEIDSKDVNIDSKKIHNKKGYDLFNTIFFQRHRSLMMKSAITYTLVILGIILVLVIAVIGAPSYRIEIGNELIKNLGYIVIVMYFINRGRVVTQAMFYNCDHAMLSYNFYREPKTLVGLFRRRLITVISINLLPASVLALGLVVIIFLTGIKISVISYLAIFIFIILLSVFFSTHELVLYYLLQPFNIDTSVKDVRYNIIAFFTYLLAFYIKDFKLPYNMLVLWGSVITVVYVIVGIILVRKMAPESFKLK
jgi:hypothetical protein